MVHSGKNSFKLNNFNEKVLPMPDRRLNHLGGFEQNF